MPIIVGHRSFGWSEKLPRIFQRDYNQDQYGDLPKLSDPGRQLLLIGHHLISNYRTAT